MIDRIMKNYIILLKDNCLKMRYILMLLLIISFQVSLISSAFFCFPACNSQCGGSAYVNCQGSVCQGGSEFYKPSYAGGTYTCIKSPYTYYSTGAKWQPCARSPDIPSGYTMGTSVNITIQTLTMSIPTILNCTYGTNYNYFGDLQGGDTILITHPGVIDNVNYYQVRILYGVITFDEFNLSTLIKTTFVTDPTSAIQTANIATNGQIKLCKDATLFQGYSVILRSWAWGAKTDFKFLVSTSNTNITQLWGVMNAIISIRLCHPYCTVCTGDSNINVCTACNYVGQQARLSGNTCALTCLTGYGDNSLQPEVCISCPALCKYCLDIPGKCRDCNSPYLLFPNTTTNITCVSVCPSHYYPETSGNDTCIICDANCLNCNTIPTNCTSCDPGSKLSGNTCALTCLAGYGDNSPTPVVCIVCQPLCKYCLDLSKMCLDCYSPYFLFPNTPTNISCITACPSHYYPKTSGNDTCIICDENCLECTAMSTKCTSCYLGTYLYQNTCWSPCPDETYSDDPTQTCKPCNNYCYKCALSSTNCSICDTTGPYISYLQNGDTCTINCGNSFYPENNGGAGPNTCQPCDAKCVTCAITGTNCSSCAAGFYRLGNVCDSTCPFPEYFTDNATWTCQSSGGVTSNVMNVYWKNTLHEDLVCDLTFSQNLSWGPSEIHRFLTVSVDDSTVSLDTFNFVYEAVTPRIMRLTLSPKGYTFIYNVTFNFKTMSLTNGNYDFAANNYRFSDTCYDVSALMVWFLIKAPSLSESEKKIIDGVSTFSNKVEAITTLPYVQEIKKAGVFAMLMGGAQITSTACLVNSVPSQNFYQGMRLWASFVYFDVPPWQQNSKKKKYAVDSSVQDLIKNARLLQDHSQIHNRTLFDTSSIGWRFQRTGYTSFFLFDTYINIFLIVLCWILLAIAHCCIKHKAIQKRVLGAFYSFTLKVHEVTIFYISLSTFLQWIYFDAASIQRWISFGICILFNVYFLLYEFYISYDMVKYPTAVIGNEKYEYYCVRYGSLLKDVRFQQYNAQEEWSVKHWLRPYNYHIVSYYKNFLMMISLPIFYSTRNAQICVLISIQLFEIIRFIVVWPFKSNIRNLIRLGLQCCLMVFFITIIIQSFEMVEIMIKNPETLQSTVDIFYKIGWVGFIACWTVNFGFILMLIFDTILGCIRSNREMMDQARRIYYMERLKQYEQQNEDIPPELISKWVKLGNLNNRKYDDLLDLNLRVEYFRVNKSDCGFEVDMKKFFQVSMNEEFNIQKQINFSAGKNINKRFSLTRSLSPTLYAIMENLYNHYIETNDFQYMNIKTLHKIIQSAHKPGQKIQLNPSIMEQSIELQTFTGQKQVIKLDKLLPGFPLTYEDLKQFAEQ